MAVRAGIHNGRVNAKGKAYSPYHNDRNKKMGEAEHIDKAKSQNNKTWHIFQKSHPEMTFDDAEALFYENHFSKSLETQNNKHIKAGNKSRVKTMDELRKTRLGCPEEIIFTLGTMKEHEDAETLYKAVKALMVWQQKEYPQAKILDYALHVDEATPHIQMRQVWIAHDENGNEIVNQGKALQEMGVERPNLDFKESRRNNAKITFSDAQRAKFQEICLDMGIDLITEPKDPGENGLSLNAYKIKEMRKDIEALQNELDSKDNELASKNALIESLKAEIQALEDNINSKQTSIKSLNGKLTQLGNDIDKMHKIIENEQLHPEMFNIVVNKEKNKTYIQVLDEINEIAIKGLEKSNRYKGNTPKNVNKSDDLTME